MTTKTTTIIAIGNSCGIILSKELLAKLRVGKGDTVYISETPDGIEIQTGDAQFGYAMELAEAIMREDRDVLKKLAE